VGGLDEQVSESSLWELFLQAGPVGMYPDLHVENTMYTCNTVDVYMPILCIPVIIQ